MKFRLFFLSPSTPRSQERQGRFSLLGVLGSLVYLAINITAGCSHLSKGNAETITPQNKTVYLIRGFQDWYSTGIDTLADELKAQQIQTETFRESQWHELEDALVKQSPSPIILIGFSYGADDVISIARTLKDKNIPVDLLITIDPVTPSNIPDNVKVCKNFYEPNGFTDVFPWLRGVPLKGENNNSAVVENINIRARDDLNEPDTAHSTIAGNPRVHSAIVNLVAASLAKH